MGLPFFNVKGNKMAIFSRNDSIKKHYKDEAMKIYLLIVKLVCFKNSSDNINKDVKELFYNLNFIRLCHRAGNSLSQEELLEQLYQPVRDRIMDVRGFIAINNPHLNRSNYTNDRVMDRIKKIYKEITLDIYDNHFCALLNSPTLEEVMEYNTEKGNVN